MLLVIFSLFLQLSPSGHAEENFRVRTASGALTYVEVRQYPVQNLGFDIGKKCVHGGLYKFGDVIDKSAKELKSILSTAEIANVRGVLAGYRTGLRGEEFSSFQVDSSLNEKLNYHNVRTADDLVGFSKRLYDAAIKYEGRIGDDIAHAICDILRAQFPTVPTQHRLLPANVQEVARVIYSLHEYRLESCTDNLIAGPTENTPPL